MKHYWTVYCAMPGDPRGQYSEEFDVVADTPTHARQAAEKLMSDGYDKELKVRRVIRRQPEVQIFHLNP